MLRRGARWHLLPVVLTTILLFGAKCVYLLMGLIWAILYGLIFQFLPGSFHSMEGVDDKAYMDTLLY